MIDRDDMQKLAQIALSASEADQTEVVVSAGNQGLTRFANNIIHQNVYESSVSISLRAVVGKQIGIASTNDPSPEALRNVAKRAVELARHAAANEDFISLPSPPEEAVECDLAPVPATVAFGPEDRAAAVREMLAIAAEDSLTAAGQFTTGEGAMSVHSSLGVQSHFAASSALGRVVMQAEDSSGFAEAVANDVGEISAERLGRIAADKAAASAGPRDVEPGEYTVILEPLAVGDIVSMLAVFGLQALAHQEGRSFSSERMGEKVCGENITIWDDGWDPRGDRMPFDGEGIPRQRVSLIERGILKGVTYDSFTAGREPGATNTGHALPAPNTWGPVPIHVFMQTGDDTLADMIEQTERGLLVTRFHYTNIIHPIRTVFTGMTRDGTFLIEGGEIVGGVKNLRFTQSLLDALSNVDMIGEEGVRAGHAWVPPIRVQGFSFSSATSF